MHKSATKFNVTVGKWCKNKHGASKIIDTLETYHQSEGPNNTRFPHLRDATVKVVAGLGVEVRHIYSFGRRSHHPNSASQQTYPNPNQRSCRLRSGEGDEIVAAWETRERTLFCVCYFLLLIISLITPCFNIYRHVACEF
jgi:hypothetical protein